MPTKPTTSFNWDDNETNSTQPSSSLRSDGYATNDIPTSANFNYQLNSVGQHIQYLEDITDSLGGAFPALALLLGNPANQITTPATSTITGIANNGTGTITGVSAGGSIFYSTDYGVNWKYNGQLKGSVAFNDIVYRSSGTLWTAVGDGGKIYTATSPSGTWTSRTSGVATDLNGCYDDGTTLTVVGDSNVILTATDPTSTYTSRTSALAGGTQLNDVIKGGSTWLIVANGGLAQTASDPTSTWTSRTTGVSTNLYGVEYGNSTFVIGGAATGGVGTLLTSTNPTSSFSTPIYSEATTDVRRGAYNTNSGLFVMGSGSGRLLYSSDLSNWYAKSTGSTDFYSANYNASKRITVGGTSGGFYQIDDLETLRDSIDTNKQIQASTAAFETLKHTTAFTNAVVTTFQGGYGKTVLIHTGTSGKLVAIGTANDIVSTSTTYKFAQPIDAAEGWTSRSAAVNFTSLDGNSTYTVAVGGDTNIYRSTDAVTFSTTSIGATAVTRVACSENNFVVCSSSANFFRYTGSNPSTGWANPTTSPGAACGDIAWFPAAQLFIAAVGTHIWTSPTGDVWTDRGAILSASGPIFSVGPNKIYAAGDTNTSYWSYDGINWTACVLENSNRAYRLQECVTRNGTSFAIGLGQTTDTTNSCWLLSADGTNFKTCAFNGLGNPGATVLGYIENMGIVFYVDTNNDLNFSRPIK